MKEFTFQKLDGKLRLIGSSVKEYAEFVASAKDRTCYVATFKEVSTSKTMEQLGYYYGCVVPDVCAGLRHLGWDEVGYREVLDTRVPLPVNTENVDQLLKTVYAISRGIPVPSKSRMSKAEMSDFISVVLSWCFENQIPIHSSEEFYG